MRLSRPLTCRRRLAVGDQEQGGAARGRGRDVGGAEQVRPGREGAGPATVGRWGESEVILAAWGGRLLQGGGAGSSAPGSHGETEALRPPRAV